MVGKPNQVIPKAGLQSIPAFDESFSRIIIDCVGTFSKIKSGNEYLFTIMCASTRFSEAIPLRNIKTKTIFRLESSLSLFLSRFSLIRVQILCLVFSSK